MKKKYSYLVIFNLTFIVFFSACPGGAPWSGYEIYNHRSEKIKLVSEKVNEEVSEDQSYCFCFKDELTKKPSEYFTSLPLLVKDDEGNILIRLTSDNIDEQFKRISEDRYRLDVN